MEKRWEFQTQQTWNSWTQSLWSTQRLVSSASSSLYSEALDHSTGDATEATEQKRYMSNLVLEKKLSLLMSTAKVKHYAFCDVSEQLQI